VNGRKPNKAEREWLDKICESGCCVCANEFAIYSPAEPHHMDGCRKPDCHFKTIPLCPNHHRNGGYGVALHAGRAQWEKLYGTQAELLKQVQELINA